MDNHDRECLLPIPWAQTIAQLLWIARCPLPPTRIRLTLARPQSLRVTADTNALECGADTAKVWYLLEAYATDAYQNERLTQHPVRVLVGLDQRHAENLLARYHAQRPFRFEDMELQRRSGEPQ